LVVMAGSGRAAAAAADAPADAGGAVPAHAAPDADADSAGPADANSAAPAAKRGAHADAPAGSVAPKRKLLPRDERTAQILRGAAAAFARSGFAATSMDDVAEACGVSRLLVYRHFTGKEELYRAILQEVFDFQAQEFVTRLGQNDMRGLGARTLLSVAREHPHGFVLLWRHAAREPQFAAYAEEQRRVAVDAVQDIMALGDADPVFDRWWAETIYGWLLEAVLTWLELGDPSRDDEFVDHTTEALRQLRLAIPPPAPAGR
jgi:AcrR family transcriptional regulator